MAAVFSQVLNMSMTGSIVILLVMLSRVLLKRSPKIFSYALWSVVLFRLLCPVAFTAPVSVLNAFRPEVKEASEAVSIVYFLPAEKDRDSEIAFVPAESQIGTAMARAAEADAADLDLMSVISHVWITGIAVMILCSIIQYTRLRRNLIGAVLYRGDVYLADHMDTPFVMGILRPKIYLPSNIPAGERKYIIAHERHHIRRFDHVIKLLAYAALCIHWFNPLVWLAFLLAGGDMEMSCDEAVIKKLGPQIRADYSASLLRLATPKKIIAGMPLAFGEGDTKGRVMNMAKWKKPRLGVSLICLLLCTSIFVACAVNPETAGSTVGTNGTEITGKVTTANGLNIREEPTTSSTAVGNYTDGTIVTILEIKDGWGRTDLGWISLNYITTMDGTPIVDIGQIEPPAVTDIENKVKELNIREKPDMSSAVVGCYPDGTTVTILETRDGWGRTDKGWIYMEWVATIDGNTIVDVADYEPATELVQYGTLKMLLPSGFSSAEQDGAVVLLKDTVVVGGITCWNHPGFEPDDMIKWMKALGIPELQDDYDVPIGYMAGNSAYGGWEIEFFWDGNPGALSEQHTFFIDGSIVYDVWYEENQITDGIAERFLKTVAINTEPVSASSEEQEALAKCRAVLEQIQSSGAYKIATERQNGANALNDRASLTEWGHDGDRLHICLIPESGGSSTVGGLLVDSRMYECDSMREWRETARWDWQDPWLASFRWDESVVAYTGTMENEDGTKIMLRIDQLHEEGEEEQPYYFVTFSFDPSGAFLSASIQANLFMDSQFTEKESVVSLDPNAVAEEIQEEYRKMIQ